MHWHISWAHALAAFLAILPMGTLWRLVAAHLAVRPGTSKLGAAMAFQY